MGTLTLSLHWPYSSASTTQNYNISVPMHYGDTASPTGGSGQLLVKWQEEKCLRFESSLDGGSRSISAGKEEPDLSNATKSFPMFEHLTRVTAGKGDAFITSLHTVCFCCYFHVTARLHLRKQGSLKVKHSALSISNFRLLDTCNSFYFLLHISTMNKRNYSISVLHTLLLILGPSCYLLDL